jgi:6-phosphogluconolactonase
MKLFRFSIAILCVAVLLDAGCGRNLTRPSPTPTSCVPSSKPEFAYALTDFAVSMYTVDSCTGAFRATSPASVATGYALPQQGAEQMVVDPRGRFAYVANLVSNATDLATISMYTINATTGVLTPTSPATVPTGFFPQGIAIDPLGRFVYTANTDDSTVSMFTINQTTGLLTPTSPATVFTGGIPFQVVVAPSGKFAYVVNNLSGGEMTDGVWQYTINPTTGILTQNTPATIAAGNAPTEIAVDPTSRFAYVVNRLDNTVSMFTIDPGTGNLAPNSTASNPTATIATGTEPFRIDFDPTGKFVYVTNEGSAASIYTVNSDGTLINAGVTGVASGALSTAITAVSQ